MHQSVLVTGASSGIGEATAVHLAHHGFRVFAAARRKEKLEELRGLAGGRITPLAMDVTDDASVDRALEEIQSTGGGLYGLVNNAGVSITGPVEQVSIDDWRRQYETNVFGAVRATQKVLPIFREAGRGRVINIGSVAGRIAPPFLGVYASSKHALEGVTDALRRELAPHGVKVSLIRPGFINTPFGHQEQEGFEKYLGADQPYDGQLRIFKSWHAKGHPTAPPPTVVAEAVHKALTAERPQSRYSAPVQTLGLLMLRNFLPSAIIDRIFERITGLNTYKKENSR